MTNYNWHRDARHIKSEDALHIQHRSKSGKITITINQANESVVLGGMKRGTMFQVSAMDGHELLPRTKGFNDLAEAKAYANDLWKAL